MKAKLHLQLIILLLALLLIAAAWIGTQVARDGLQRWSEPATLRFATPDLLGLMAGSELRCAGTTIGRVRTIRPSLGTNGQPQFELVAGVKKEFTAWTLAPSAHVRPSLVEAAFAPSTILLQFSTADDAVRARLPSEGGAPTLPLTREPTENDLAEIAARVNALTEQIDLTVRQFTEPQNGRSRSVIQELAETIPAAAATLRHIESMTAQLERDLGEKGRIDQTLGSLNATLANVEELTAGATKTFSTLSLQLDTGLGKVNRLLDETTATMSSVHGKVEGFGGTFLGRMIIAPSPGDAQPQPTPKSTPRPPARIAR